MQRRLCRVCVVQGLGFRSALASRVREDAWRVRRSVGAGVGVGVGRVCESQGFLGVKRIQ